MFIRNIFIGKQNHTITIVAATGGDKILSHVLRRPGASEAVNVNNKAIAFKQTAIEKLNYADFEINAAGIKLSILIMNDINSPLFKLHT